MRLRSNLRQIPGLGGLVDGRLVGMGGGRARLLGIALVLLCTGGADARRPPRPGVVELPSMRPPSPAEVLGELTWRRHARLVACRRGHRPDQPIGVAVTLRTSSRDRANEVGVRTRPRVRAIERCVREVVDNEIHQRGIFTSSRESERFTTTFELAPIPAFDQLDTSSISAYLGAALEAQTPTLRGCFAEGVYLEVSLRVAVFPSGRVHAYADSAFREDTCVGELVAAIPIPFLPNERVDVEHRLVTEE